ncbi:MAG: isoprenylcysteine carboxylmethyltransferase family protein [Proteobacteria bacterium]|nr:isoprenylcysteine carboxylmethyltransferase family protein [Pseudomonadota bacterium]
MDAPLFKAILILPGTVLVFVPALIAWGTKGTSWAVRPPHPGEFPFWIGLASAALGLALAISTMRDFQRLGQGTPAPWAPPKNLVLSGPYRHVRNPMISGVLFMLAAESLLLGTWALALWLAAFFTANAFYIPLVEEKGLEERFGDAYRLYKANVPRWIPRPRPWQPPGE